MLAVVLHSSPRPQPESHMHTGLHQWRGVAIGRLGDSKIALFAAPQLCVGIAHCMGIAKGPTYTKGVAAHLSLEFFQAEAEGQLAQGRRR